MHKHHYRLAERGALSMRFRCRYCRSRLVLRRQDYRDIMAGTVGIEEHQGQLHFIDLEG